MIRVLTTCVLALALSAFGCAKDAPSDSDAATGGTGGRSGAGGSATSTGGAGGSRGSTGGAGGDVAAGTGGSAAGGSGGTGGTPADAAVDLPPSNDADASADDALIVDAPAAPASDGPVVDSGLIEVGGTKLPDRPWIHLCPKDYTQPQCCEYLCACLKTNCAEEKNVDSCMASCAKAADHATRCRVFQCYESLDPRVPQDHVSHCGHASGRVGGGDCPEGV